MSGRALRAALVLGVAYGVVSYLVVTASGFDDAPGNVFWPGAGITLGFLVMRPRREWPLLLLAVFLAESIVDWTLYQSVSVVAIWGAANTIEPLVGALLMTRGGRRPQLDDASAVLRFLAFGVIAGPVVGTTIGSINTMLVYDSAFWPTWPRWFVGDAIGVLVIAPALFTPRRRDLVAAGPREQVLLVLALASVTVATVFPRQGEAWEQGLPYLLAPTLVLLAIRLGPFLAAVSLALATVVINTVTVAGFGPFTVTGLGSGLIIAQVCIAGAAVAMLTTSALTHDLVSVQKVEELMRDQALHDGLTGVGNRRLLTEQLTAALHRGPSRPNGPTGAIAVLMLDLDDFKSVNDAHGHLAGDAALVETARRITERLRPEDLVVRLGGDEFLVLLQDVANREDAVLVQQRLLAELAEPMVWNGRLLPLSATAGLAMVEDLDTTIDQVLAEADRAMYAAKASRHAHRPTESDGAQPQPQPQPPVEG
jgi:diguanylate cyclase (GGDEF)-like protein